MILPFERLAMRNEPMPDDLDLADQLMFQALAMLYSRYRREEISRENASAEKQRMCFQYRKLKKNISDDRDLAAWQFNLKKEIEGAQCRFRKERSMEAAEALSDALDGRVFHGCPPEYGKPA